MTSTTKLTRRALALAFSFGALAAACGDSGDAADDAVDTTAAGTGDEVVEAAAGSFDGVSVTVGSKDFTENILLGEMLAIALEEAGAEVDNQTNLGGTVVNRDALEAGSIDVYPEYNGTGWTVHLGQEEPSSDSAELFNSTAEMDLAENGIRWLGVSPFNNTYGFATGPEFTEANGGPFTLDTMAAHLEANPDATLCLETEFPDRPDGLVLFEEATGYDVPDSQIQILDTGLIYTETAEGSCDFGEVFATDGRIPALDMSLVEDPGVFILYNASFTISDEVYQQNPEGFEQLADAILDPIDASLMAELNAAVDVEGRTHTEVAREYLETEGILS